MARLERDERYRGPCPCGKHEVVLVFWSPTAPFQSGHEDVEIDCPSCAKEWTVERMGRWYLKHKTEQRRFNLPKDEEFVVSGLPWK